MATGRGEPSLYCEVRPTVAANLVELVGQAKGLSSLLRNSSGI